MIKHFYELHSYALRIVRSFFLMLAKEVQIEAFYDVYNVYESQQGQILIQGQLLFEMSLRDILFGLGL